MPINNIITLLCYHNKKLVRRAQYKALFCFSHCYTPALAKMTHNCERERKLAQTASRSFWTSWNTFSFSASFLFKTVYFKITLDLQKSYKNNTDSSHNPLTQLLLILTFIWISPVSLLMSFFCSRIPSRIPQCFVPLVSSDPWQFLILPWRSCPWHFGRWLVSYFSEWVCLMFFRNRSEVTHF